MGGFFSFHNGGSIVPRLGFAHPLIPAKALSQPKHLHSFSHHKQDVSKYEDFILFISTNFCVGSIKIRPLWPLMLFEKKKISV